MAENFYWNLNKTMSYNKLFNFIVGSRGAGKTYGSKQYVLNRWLKKQEQFVYMRRYNSELKLNKDIWRDMRLEFPEHDLTQKHQAYFVNGLMAGNGMDLSTADKYKSVSFQGVTTIIFDEFMVDNPRSSYLSNEVQRFLDAYETISRMRDVRVLFLANAISSVNPYFTYFHIEIPDHGFKVYDDILVERVENPAYIDAKEKTRFGKLLKNSKYMDYSLRNKFLADNDTFIEAKTGSCRYSATIKSSMGDYGIWTKPGIAYISEDLGQSPYVISVDLEAHETGAETIKGDGAKQYWSWVKQKFNRGELRFENQKCKFMFLEVYGRSLT